MGAVKTYFGLLLAAFLSQASVLAQAPVVETGATKPIQQSRTEVLISATLQPPTTREVRLRAGTPLDIEAVYTVSSLDLKAGDLLTFRALIPIVIDGVTVIDKGSLVTARVAEAKRGGHWGKAGRLSWSMRDVVAVDLTRVPLQAQNDLPTGRNGIKGTSHGGEVATRTIVMGALLAPVFPIAPLALMSGFKRGEDAVLPAGKRFVVFVQSDTSVKVPGEH
jgi:hypothetical protein